jgi:hypothetical protein
MRQGWAVATAGFGACLLCAPSTLAFLIAPTAACAQDKAQNEGSGPDPATKIVLMGAPFANSDAPPRVSGEPPASAQGRLTAMAFLPGRGVIAWDVTGKTPEQAKEAQIEAMGLADARAVQKEIDAAAEADERARQASGSGRTALLASSQGRGALGARGLALAGLHQASAILPLSRAARAQSLAGVRNGEALKDRPRVYAFAAASGQGLGFNMTHDDGSWKTAGLTTDRGGFVGQKQAGLAWRAGAAQASLSYVQQKTETQILGMEKIKDHRLMLTMNVQPKAIVRFLTGQK